MGVIKCVAYFHASLLQWQFQNPWLTPPWLTPYLRPTKSGKQTIKRVSIKIELLDKTCQANIRTWTTLTFAGINFVFLLSEFKSTMNEWLSKYTPQGKRT